MSEPESVEPGAAPVLRQGKPSILIVCTGNLCRSPAAAFLLTQMLGRAADGYSIRSAGIAAQNGAPIDPTIARLLQRKGIDASSFVAQEVSVDMLETADLVLTASTEHRAATVQAAPATLRRTLTLKQLARYAPYILDVGDAPHTVEDRVAWLLDSVPLARALAIEHPRGNDSVPDPIGQSFRRYSSAFAQIERACAAIAPLLGEADAAPTRVGVGESPEAADAAVPRVRPAAAEGTRSSSEDEYLPIEELLA